MTTPEGNMNPRFTEVDIEPDEDLNTKLKFFVSSQLALMHGGWFSQGAGFTPFCNLFYLHSIFLLTQQWRSFVKHLGSFFCTLGFIDDGRPPVGFVLGSCGVSVQYILVLDNKHCKIVHIKDQELKTIYYRNTNKCHDTIFHVHCYML